MLTSALKSTLKAHNPFRFDKEVISGLFTYCGHRNMCKIDGKARSNVEIKYFFKFHFKNLKNKIGTKPRLSRLVLKQIECCSKQFKAALSSANSFICFLNRLSLPKTGESFLPLNFADAFKSVYGCHTVRITDEPLKLHIIHLF